MGEGPLARQGHQGGEGDPLAMSTAEKLACEWEARHDVQARRGRPVDPASVAHYVAHARRDAALHSAHRGSRGHPDQEARLNGHREPGSSAPVWLRGWLRWGEDDRG